VRSLRDWGQQGKYNHVRHGFNCRMDAIQGAALRVKLRRLDGWNAARRRVASAYQAGLVPGIRRPASTGPDYAAHVYAIRVSDRDNLRGRLAETGIATSIHYPVPVHLQPAYAHLGYVRGDFPNAEALAQETLSLPLYPEIPPQDVERVIEAVNLAETRLPDFA
jgi:dTDP-4-amino-4,6-dideoxygalactose transaminase